MKFSCTVAKPLVAAIDSKTMFTVPLPVPVELASDPGAQLEELVQDVPTANKKIHAGLRMLFAYFKQLKSVATQLKCDISIIDEAAGARSEDTSNPSWKTALEHVGNTVLNAPNHHSAICSHLLVRLGLVKHMLSAQEDLRDILTKLEPEMSTEGEPMLNDIVLFERRMQLEMFRVIKADLVHHNNELHESRSYILSSEVESTVLHRYMGQLSSLIINLAVQAVAPPLTISTYESSEMGLANDVQSSSEEDAQLLASAYYNKDSLLRTTEGFLKAPQSVESFSLYELSEEYIEISDSTSIKMNNSIIKWMSKRYESFESKNEFRGHLLPLFVPEKIEISVFFVVLQQSYKPIGVDGLDATLLLSELQRFKLSSQRLAITMHTNNINGEDRLMRALMACRRSVHKTDGHTQNHVYLDPWCLWGHVRDEEETKRKIEISKSIQRLVRLIYCWCF